MRWIGSGREPPPPRRLRGLFGRGQDVTGEQRGSLPCTVMRSFTWPRVSRRNPPPRVSRADRHFAHFSVVFFFSSTPVHSRLRGSSSFPETGVANDFSGFHAGLFSFAYIVMFITQKFSFKCR